MVDRKRWLARLSFSFFIIALVLSWQAYKVSSVPGAEKSWRAGLLLAGAVLAGILGAAGIRARHRDDDR